jgi:glycosyltransferase involved in cell wall biosynthesis
LSDAEYQTIFPTKTIEYLICGRPILAHTPPNCFLTRFLQQWDCALIVEEPTVDAVVAAIARLRSDKALRDRLVGNALKAAEQFQAEHVAAHLRKMLFA